MEEPRKYAAEVKPPLSTVNTVRQFGSRNCDAGTTPERVGEFALHKKLRSLGSPAAVNDEAADVAAQA